MDTSNQTKDLVGTTVGWTQLVGGTIAFGWALHNAGIKTTPNGVKLSIFCAVIAVAVVIVGTFTLSEARATQATHRAPATASPDRHQRQTIAGQTVIVSLTSVNHLIGVDGEYHFNMSTGHMTGPKQHGLWPVSGNEKQLA